MFKKLVLIAVVLTALLATASPAFAASGTYYVDTNYTGTEVGTTKAQPFNTVNEAIAAAQANPGGGYIYTGTANTENWTYYAYYPPINPPNTGAPLSAAALFVLLGVASLILLVTGWFLMRRSRTLPNHA
jgi:hypothetical protein